MDFWEDDIDLIDSYKQPERTVTDPEVSDDWQTQVPGIGVQPGLQSTMESAVAQYDVGDKYRASLNAAQSPGEFDAHVKTLPDFGATRHSTMLPGGDLINSIMSGGFSVNPDIVKSFVDEIQYNFEISIGPMSIARVPSVLTDWEADNCYYLEIDEFGINRKFKNGIMVPEDYDKVSILKDAFGKAVKDAREVVKSPIENSQVQRSSKIGASLQGYNKYKVVRVSFNGSNEQFYSKLDNLYDLAFKYANSNVALANSLTLQFIRRDKYNGLKWDEVAGVIDNEFITYVIEKNPDLARFFSPDLTFTDPSGNVIDFAHFAATLNVQIFSTTSLRSIVVPEKHIDNLGGWAGDLQTFVGDVRKLTNNSSDYSVVYQAAYQLFGSQNTTFSMSNLFADVDAVNLSKQLNSSPLGSVFRNYYSYGGYKTRMIHFVQSITGDATINKENLNSLVGVYTYKYWAMGVAWPLLNGVDVSASESVAIRDAFTDRIWDMVEQERTKLLHEI